MDIMTTLLRHIGDQRIHQSEVADAYAMALVSSEATDWPKVNRAIIDRWSLAGLKRVKRLAWKVTPASVRLATGLDDGGTDE